VKQTIRLGDWSTSLDLYSAFHHLIVQTESQPYLAFEFQNNYYTYKATLFGTKLSQIHFVTAIEPIMQQIRMKTEIRIINYIDGILLLHQNKEYLKNITLKVIETLKYFGFTINSEKSEWIKTGTELTVKQTAKLIGQLNYIRLQFLAASLFLNSMDHQKAQAARLRGWNTTMIMNKTTIPDINWRNAKLKANIHAQLIQIPRQMTMTTDAAPSGWGSGLEKELEMIAMAQGT
ncbi:MAG: hypothetical protein EZS28_046297, partial [Streblomastix strix]